METAQPLSGALRHQGNAAIVGKAGQQRRFHNDRLHRQAGHFVRDHGAKIAVIAQQPGQAIQLLPGRERLVYVLKVGVLLPCNGLGIASAFARTIDLDGRALAACGKVHAYVVNKMVVLWSVSYNP